MRSQLVPQYAAIAAVDPGRTTGVARGVFPIADADSVEAAYAAGSQVESWECEGSLKEQTDELVVELDDWFSWLLIERSIPVTAQFLVFEDFHPRRRNVDLVPVKLTERFEARWDEIPVLPAIEKQQPSHAKTFATDARLRAWVAWVVGSAHRRDATRHVLLKISRLLG